MHCSVGTSSKLIFWKNMKNIWTISSEIKLKTVQTVHCTVQCSLLLCSSVGTSSIIKYLIFHVQYSIFKYSSNIQCTALCIAVRCCAAVRALPQTQSQLDLCTICSNIHGWVNIYLEKVFFDIPGGFICSRYLLMT